SQERYITQYLVARLVDYDATSCVDGVCSTGAIPEDPKLVFFGSSVKKKETGIGYTYTYV
ncbi:hypothetical protein LEF59_22055, partial [Salmonella enterica]|nr:hypothetical protein [Salmonella enterica]